MTILPHTQSTCATPGRRRLDLRHYLAVWKQRRALARMEDWQKRDLGLTDDAIAAEITRSPWDAPANWRR